MRLFVALLALTAATPALACPIGTLCAIVEEPRDEVPAAKRPVSLHVELAPTDPWRLDQAPERQDDAAMPWIWKVLREGVYAQLPRYRRDALTFTPSPVVVDGVAGVGIAGNF